MKQLRNESFWLNRKLSIATLSAEFNARASRKIEFEDREKTITVELIGISANHENSAAYGKIKKIFRKTFHRQKPLNYYLHVRCQATSDKKLNSKIGIQQ